MRGRGRDYVAQGSFASLQWARQDSNLGPSDYENGPACSPLLVAARFLGSALVGGAWGS